MWATSVMFKKMPKVNKRPLGENSPNLVTLSRTLIRYLILTSSKWQWLSSFLRVSKCPDLIYNYCKKRGLRLDRFKLFSKRGIGYRTYVHIHSCLTKAF
jgi:hypothetical protein